MAKRSLRRLLGGLFLLILTGLAGACGERVEPPMQALEIRPWAEWEQVVLEATRGGGVDWAVFQAHRAELDEVLGWVATHGPESSRVPESKEIERLASQVNIHNVLVIDAILRRVWRPDADLRLLRVPRQTVFQDEQRRVDGEWIPLWRLASHRIVANFQNPELHGALYLGTRDGPRLRFWRAEVTEAVLKLGFYDWLMRDGGMRPASGGWAVTADLYDHAKDFRDWDGAGNLCIGLYEYVSGERRRWLYDHLEDCPLGRFEPEDLLDQPTR